MDFLRVDSENGVGGDLLTSTIAIGEREVRQALALHAVDRIISHADIRFSLTNANNVDDDNNQQQTNNNNNVNVFTVSSQSEIAKQFLDGFGGLAAFLRWPVPRELLLHHNQHNNEDDDNDQN